MGYFNKEKLKKFTDVKELEDVKKSLYLAQSINSNRLNAELVQLAKMDIATFIKLDEKKREEVLKTPLNLAKYMALQMESENQLLLTIKDVQDRLDELKGE